MAGHRRCEATLGRGNRAYQRRDRPRGKTSQRGKASRRRRHDEEVPRADLNANSLSSLPPHLVPARSLDQKSHDETDRARFFSSLREDRYTIERDRNRAGLLLLSLPIRVFPRILFICARTGIAYHRSGMLVHTFDDANEHGVISRCMRTIRARDSTFASADSSREASPIDVKLEILIIYLNMLRSLFNSSACLNGNT